MKYQVDLKIDFERKAQIFNPAKRRKITEDNDQLIEDNWLLLKNKEITPNQFIDNIAGGMKHGKYARSLQLVEEGKIQ